MLDGDLSGRVIKRTFSGVAPPPPPMSDSLVRLPGKGPFFNCPVNTRLGAGGGKGGKGDK